MGTPFPFSKVDKVAPIGRRSAPRLRLSIPARMLLLTGQYQCILVNLSRSGGLIGFERPLGLNEGAMLQFAGFECFGTVIRQRSGLIAFAFEDELTDETVLAVRHYSERYEYDERRALEKSIAAWVCGDD